ncbi:Alginate export [Mariniphaga anaerophila]|uniref:Alginate export n=1 Tax=Mariniphaga anaerophila TaxID=1484053 RepID=A0A1M5A2T1_9BACT|nr:alginate export family protein [Mariniphaga anaerophila]SHF24417.1 Alginate export [Mariniphaga anaerophila]
MNRNIFLPLAAAALFMFSEARAQFVLSGEFRPRTEFSRGYKSLAAEDQKMSVTTAQRTRLNAIFNTETIKAKLVLQDVRYWGGQPQLVTNEDFATSIHEAWAEVQLAKNFSVKAGRQELVYDDSRMFGNVGWAHQARSHDLALFKIENEIKLHLGIAHHESPDITNNFYYGPDAYKNMQFLWFNKTWEKTGLSLLLLNNGVPLNISDEKQETRYSQTLGGRVTHMLSNATFAANLYYQTGKHTSGADISALNFLLEASLKNGISGGYEYLSGNSHDKYDKVYAFNPLYGTNHKFNGFMDYFYVGNHINSVGLNDIYIRYKYKKDKLGFEGHLHYFSSAGKISDSAKKYLGTELDLGVSYAVHPGAVISAGWSVMFAGESMELLKEGNHETGQHWGYIMLSVTPVFLK